MLYNRKKVNQKKKNFINIKVLLFCFLVSFFILLITSKNSFLYPFNDWVDANAFFTVGKSMFNGLVPYRDLFEQKGILLYFIYGIGYLISNTSFLGIFFVEIFFWTFGLYYVYKIANLFLKESYCYVIIPIFMTLLCTSYAFAHGGGAEEFCFPFFMISLYYFFDHFKDGDISYKRLIIAGFCAGCVFLIKYTILGFWFAFMTIIFFDLFFRKEYKKSLISCLYFLLGMSLPILVGLIYLGFNNAIVDCYNVYFKVNMTAYNSNVNNILIRLYKLIGGFGLSVEKNGSVILILMIGIPIFLSGLDINKRGKISLFFICIITIIGVFWGLKFYRYYLFPAMNFILISLIAILCFISKYINIDNKKWIIAIVFIISLFVAYNGANYKKMLFKDKNDMIQYRYANIIKQSDHPTLVNMGLLDCGLYTTSGIIPSTYFFEKQNFKYGRFPDNYDSFQRYIEEKKTEYIIYTSKKKLDKVQESEPKLFQNYELIVNDKYSYENHWLYAYLLKRKEA